MPAKKKIQPKDLGESMAEIAESLDHIRKLLIFALLRDEVSQGEIGAALGVHQSTISRLVPVSKTQQKSK